MLRSIGNDTGEYGNGVGQAGLHMETLTEEQV